MPLPSISTKKRPEGLEQGSKSASNVNLSFRSISRMGQSMTSIHKAKDLEEEEEDKPLPQLTISSKHWHAAQDSLLEDISQVRQAMDLFLNSRISDAESILKPKQDKSLYHSLGHAFILFLKSMMTFEKGDIAEAIEALKQTIQLADALRKKETGWFGNITSWVKGMSVQDVSSMSRLHRHAELVYAESYLLKALLCIVHDESLVAFLREGLHVRSSYNTYRVLHKFLSQVQDEAIQGKDVSAYHLDDHFTSGVSLGVGLFNIMISLLPASVVKVIEFVGFTSDRQEGMEILESVGGWEEYAGLALSELPPLQDANEGLRRQFCDMVIMMYHIIMPKLIPLSDINEELADRVLAYNLKLYPDGVFFLYFSGRQLSTRGLLDQAKQQYQKAIDMQKDWKQLQHMCYWELGLINSLQQNWQGSQVCYTKLQQESNWSKAVYYYLQALSLYMLSLEEKDSKEQSKLLKQAHIMMQKVTGAKQKIAGKSIPVEKFVSRKARKFIAQDDSLLLPDLEALNAFSAFEFMSRDLLEANLARTTKEIDRLSTKTAYAEVLNYYDDLCLCHYLRTMILRLLLDRYGHEDNKQKQAWKELHAESIQGVMDNADKIQLDHYIYYFTRYEEARMSIYDQDYQKAKDIIQSIIKMSEKGQFNVGAGPHAKNKYSLESNILFKCHNCLAEIDTLSVTQKK
ncbi:hypothetical protein BD560DRAFT_494053 [Blakeslea trispora]|nr:hypothetical protein BD560DRAFT_494053 [Blakeslea trispora]